MQTFYQSFPGSSNDKESAMGRPGFHPRWEDSLEKSGYPFLVFFLGESHGRGLLGYSSWGPKGQHN